MPLRLLALAGQPLFGSQWLALLTVLAGIAAFLALVAGLGRWLAATHPAPPAAAIPVVAAGDRPTPEVLAVIAGAVVAMLGRNARVTEVHLAAAPAHAPSVEVLMLQWSLEGRREIYSSHRVR